jgi:hypothetical protein
MKINQLKATIVLAALILTCLNAKAQVTIGSQDNPQKGVLLELKTKEANNPKKVTDDENVTVDRTGGGLLLPRVKLESKNTLDPFIDSQNTQEWTDNAKLTHAGMVVYNLNTLNGFQQGLYVWNGSEWSEVNGGVENSADTERYISIPSFNIELKGLGDNTCNLYDEYAKQFNLNFNDTSQKSSNSSLNIIPSHKSGRLYNPEELDYVVTYYDNRIIDIKNMDEKGNIDFEVLSLDMDANSFINVILVVK